jgi:hypothetical protein
VCLSTALRGCCFFYANKPVYKRFQKQRFWAMTQPINRSDWYR